MSSKSGRFDGQLSRLKAGAEAKATPAPTQKTVPEPEPEPQVKRDKFASYLRPEMKSKFKQAAARENRKQYEILEELLEKWLSENHPDI